jgi:CO/xanthine dehydrogenase Mo-binding subunit
VLQRTAKDAGFSAKPGKGRAFGIASTECYGTHLALVAEVSGTADEVKLEKFTFAVDCGIAVHPEQVIAQLQSGAVTRLIDTLSSEVTVKNGRIEQTNFDTFPIPRMFDVPPIEVSLMPNGERPGGIRETSPWKCSCDKKSVNSKIFGKGGNCVDFREYIAPNELSRFWDT